MQLRQGALPTGVDEAVRRADYEPVAISMGAVAGVDIASAASTPIAVTFRRKVIVVYEYDAIVSGDVTTTTAINAAIKTNKVPVILVGNVFKSKSDLPKGHDVFEMPMPPSQEIRVVFREGPDSLEDKGLSGAEAALSGKQQEYRGDGIALGGVFDNYLSDSQCDYYKIAQSFSDMDAVNEGLCRTGNYDDPYSSMPLQTAASACSKTPKKIVTFGTVWSKTNAMYAKVNSARSVSKALTDAGSVSRWSVEEGLAFLRLVISQHVQRGDHEAAAAAAKNAGLTPAALLLLMRLWKSKYTLATHSKVKKLM